MKDGLPATKWVVIELVSQIVQIQMEIVELIFRVYILLVVFDLLVVNNSLLADVEAKLPPFLFLLEGILVAAALGHDVLLLHVAGRLIIRLSHDQRVPVSL